MAGHPDAAELIEAVRGFLASVESRLAGREAFHAKVAGNVLAIVARELRQRPEAVERAALASVLGHDGDAAALRAELCAALRAGRIGADTPGLIDALTAATLARLAVDNPTFSTFRRLTEARP
jgi:hypothetical protein